MNSNKIKQQGPRSLDLKLLKRVLRVNSPSGREKAMRDFVVRYIRQNIKGVKVECDKVGNLYITKGKADLFPCIIAHMDSITDTQDVEPVIFADYYIMGWNHKEVKQELIGLDDKVGVYIALEVLRRKPNVKVFLSVMEEMGGVGSYKAQTEFFDDCAYLIQCDRRGCGDFIWHTNGLCIASDEFIADAYVKVASKYGYELARGTFTDVGIISSRTNLSGVNLSCGYYYEHTNREVGVIPAIGNCFNIVFELIEKLKTDKRYENYATFQQDGPTDPFYYEMEKFWM
jgi:putative aminopeptidase FrvX